MFKMKAENGSNNVCGENLTKIRKSKNMSQRQLAREMQLEGYDVDHHFIRRIENGQRFVTDMDLIILSRVLSVPVSDLMDTSVPLVCPETE